MANQNEQLARHRSHLHISPFPPCLSVSIPEPSADKKELLNTTQNFRRKRLCELISAIVLSTVKKADILERNVYKI